MAKFLSRAEVYRIIQRELPPDTYPDGAPSAFWSTADSDATAQTVATLYANMERIYANQWPQTADERLADWEVKMFGAPLTGSLTTQQRRDKLLAKARAKPTLNPRDMLALVAVHIGELYDPYVYEYIEWSVANDATSGDTVCWSLGMSQLGWDTYLCGSRARVFGPEACDVEAADIGVSEQTLLDIREGAYTIELRIYERTLDATVKAQLLADLNNLGRASEDHIITENVPWTRNRYRGFLTALPSTSLLLYADTVDRDLNFGLGKTYWYDQSPAANHAVSVGFADEAALAAIIEASPNFLDRFALRSPGDTGIGFHAPGDDINASTKRTYEVVIDDYGDNSASQFIIGRVDGGATQYGNLLYKNLNGNIEAAVYNSAGSAPWIGSDKHAPNESIFDKPVLLTIVIDAPARTMRVYENGVIRNQIDNPLSGSLATPTGLHLGIFGRWNGSSFASPFTGSILEVARHEVALTADEIAARAAVFNALKGY